MQRSKATALLLVCGVALLGASCNKKKPPARVNYCYLAVLPDDAPIGGKVFHNGEQVGHGIEKGPRYEGHFQAGLADRFQKVPTDKPLSLVCVRPEVWLSDGGALTIERKTPCGDKPLTLTPRTPVTRDLEERAREEHDKDSKRMLTVFVDYQGQGQLPQTNVWYVPPTDAVLSEDVTIHVGQASHTYKKGYKPKGGSPMTVPFFDLGCQAAHTVKVGDRELGTLQITDGPPKGVILNDREGCLRLENAVYSYADSPGQGGGGFKKHLRGTIIPLAKIDRIDHFLERAPGAKSRGKMSVIELVPEPCRDEEGAAPAKPKRGAAGGKLR